MTDAYDRAREAGEALNYDETAAKKSMAIKYTEKEYKALNDKERNPEAVVVCPRCGKELGYRSIGSSYEVKCPTENCLKLAVRGL